MPNLKITESTLKKLLQILHNDNKEGLESMLCDRYNKVKEDLYLQYKLKYGRTVLYDSIRNGKETAFKCASFLLSKGLFNVNELTKSDIQYLLDWNNNEINLFLKERGILQGANNLIKNSIFSPSASSSEEREKPDEKNSGLRQRKVLPICGE